MASSRPFLITSAVPTTLNLERRSILWKLRTCDVSIPKDSEAPLQSCHTSFSLRLLLLQGSNPVFPNTFDKLSSIQVFKEWDLWH